MKKTLKTNSAATPRRRFHTALALPAAKSAANWAPEPCRIPRDEMRRIVAEMLG